MSGYGVMNSCLDLTEKSVFDMSLKKPATISTLCDALANLEQLHKN